MGKRAGEDFFERHRQRRQQVWRDLRAVRVSELVGVVQPGGVGGSRTRGEKQWTLEIPLLAWRVGDGPVQHGELGLLQRASRQAVDRMEGRFKGYEVVRVRARVPEKDAPVLDTLDTPQALLVKFVRGPRDTEIERVAKKLRAPVRVRDERLGVFTLDRSAGTFDGRAAWGKRRVRLTLHPARGGKAEPALAAAARLFRAHAKVDAVARAQITDKFHTLWMKSWREPGMKLISADKFATKLKLETVAVHPNGKFELWYEDEDLFGDHCLVAEGKMPGGVTKVSLEG